MQKRPSLLQYVQLQARAQNMKRGPGNECQLPLVTLIGAFVKYTNGKQYIAALQRVGQLTHVSKGSLVVLEVPMLWHTLYGVKLEANKSLGNFMYVLYIRSEK